VVSHVATGSKYQVVVHQVSGDIWLEGDIKQVTSDSMVHVSMLSESMPGDTGKPYWYKGSVQILKNHAFSGKII